MKKILTVLLLFSIAITFSQTKGNIEMGANIGYNSSIISGDQLAVEYGNGVNIGLAADYYFSDRWSIKAKLIYDQKGWNKDFYTDDGWETYYPTNINLNYITMPVMANWHFATKRNWYLNFGPYVGFLVSAKETTGGNDVSHIFTSNDFGLAFGIGVKIPVSDKLKLFLEYDAQSGGTDILKPNPDQLSATNVRGAFNVGVNFLVK